MRILVSRFVILNRRNIIGVNGEVVTVYSEITLRHISDKYRHIVFKLTGRFEILGGKILSVFSLSIFFVFFHDIYIIVKNNTLYFVIGNLVSVGFKEVLRPVKLVFIIINIIGVGHNVKTLSVVYVISVNNREGVSSGVLCVLALVLNGDTVCGAGSYLELLSYRSLGKVEGVISLVYNNVLRESIALKKSFLGIKDSVTLNEINEGFAGVSSNGYLFALEVIGGKSERILEGVIVSYEISVRAVKVILLIGFKSSNRAGLGYAYDFIVNCLILNLNGSGRNVLIGYGEIIFANFTGFNCAGVERNACSQSLCYVKGSGGVVCVGYCDSCVSISKFVANLEISGNSSCVDSNRLNADYGIRNSTFCSVIGYGECLVTCGCSVNSSNGYVCDRNGFGFIISVGYEKLETCVRKSFANNYRRKSSNRSDRGYAVNGNTCFIREVCVTNRKLFSSCRCGRNLIYGNACRAVRKLLGSTVRIGYQNLNLGIIVILTNLNAVRVRGKLNSGNNSCSFRNADVNSLTAVRNGDVSCGLGSFGDGDSRLIGYNLFSLNLGSGTVYVTVNCRNYDVCLNCIHIKSNAVCYYCIVLDRVKVNLDTDYGSGSLYGYGNGSVKATVCNSNGLAACLVSCGNVERKSCVCDRLNNVIGICCECGEGIGGNSSALHNGDTVCAVAYYLESLNLNYGNRELRTLFLIGNCESLVSCCGGINCSYCKVCCGNDFSGIITVSSDNLDVFGAVSLTLNNSGSNARCVNCDRRKGNDGSFILIVSLGLYLNVYFKSNFFIGDSNGFGSCNRCINLADNKVGIRENLRGSVVIICLNLNLGEVCGLANLIAILESTIYDGKLANLFVSL